MRIRVLALGGTALHGFLGDSSPDAAHGVVGSLRRQRQQDSGDDTLPH
jgi:hypothetical protein